MCSMRSYKCSTRPLRTLVLTNEIIIFVHVLQYSVNEQDLPSSDKAVAHKVNLWFYMYIKGNTEKKEWCSMHHSTAL